MMRSTGPDGPGMARSGTSRRMFLQRSLALGCTAAASPLMAPVSLAAAPWDARLIVIILRGGMDGIGVVQPWGDPDFPGLRRGMGMVQPGGNAGRSGDGNAARGPQALDGFFGLHHSLAPLMPMWQAGELGFVNAVSTPYRDKRSHFDGQDLLEAGVPSLDASDAGHSHRDGWLNRMLQVTPGVAKDTAWTVGRSGMLLTRGAARVADWSPEAVLAMTPQARRLMEQVMHEDPLFRDVLDEAIDLSLGQTAEGPSQAESPIEAMMDRGGDMLQGMAAVRQVAQLSRDNAGQRRVAEFVADRLSGDGRIAAFSLNGWDTHSRQELLLGRSLTTLAEVLMTLRDGLGPVWGKTAVVAVTEFGRTVQVNGTKGTDHGTAGTMIFAGGALRGGHVHGDWPGLDEASLYQRRDLMPTRDVRAHIGWIMRDLFGLDRATVEGTVFPGLDLGERSSILA